MSDSATEAPSLFPAANRRTFLSYYDFNRLPKIPDRPMLMVSADQPRVVSKIQSNRFV